MLSQIFQVGDSVTFADEYSKEFLCQELGEGPFEVVHVIDCSLEEAFVDEEGGCPVQQVSIKARGKIVMSKLFTDPQVFDSLWFKKIEGEAEK